MLSSMRVTHSTHSRGSRLAPEGRGVHLVSLAILQRAMENIPRPKGKGKATTQNFIQIALHMSIQAVRMHAQYETERFPG